MSTTLPSAADKRQTITELFWSVAAPCMTRIEPAVRPSRPDAHWFFTVRQTAWDRPMLSQYTSRKIERTIHAFVAVVHQQFRGEIATVRVWVNTRYREQTHPLYVVQLVASLGSAP